jgi:signal transduction histidine kinase
LSLVDEIVRAHRGRVTLDSNLGEGSTFTMMLPILE